MALALFVSRQAWIVVQGAPVDLAFWRPRALVSASAVRDPAQLTAVRWDGGSEQVMECQPTRARRPTKNRMQRDTREARPFCVVHATAAGGPGAVPPGTARPGPA